MGLGYSIVWRVCPSQNSRWVQGELTLWVFSLGSELLFTCPFNHVLLTQTSSHVTSSRQLPSGSLAEVMTHFICVEK